MNRTKQITTVTLVGAVVNVLLTIAKCLAGIFARSSAMLADGIHSLSDLLSDAVVLVFVKLSGKERDEDHKYGHGKYETFATLVISVMLLVVAAELMSSGISKIEDIINGEEVPAPGMLALWAAIISILAKEFLYQYTVRVGRKIDSPMMIANAWHHRSDALSSIGSLLGIAGAIFLGKQYVILDPLAACVISIFIIVMSVKMSIPAIKELLEVSLPKEKEARIAEIIRSVSGVVGLHELKTRQVGSGIVMDAHLVMNSELSLRQAHDISKNVEAALHAEYGDNIQISLHLEPEDDSE